jgi:hypothetical protein
MHRTLGQVQSDLARSRHERTEGVETCSNRRGGLQKTRGEVVVAIVVGPQKTRGEVVVLNT